MKVYRLRKESKRIALLLTAVLCLSAFAEPALCVWAKAPDAVPTFDEAYYATMDYYGNLTQSSVVKSYTMNGATSITDYGMYDSVENNTNDTQADLGTGSVKFNFGDNAPEHFYFTGYTTKPFENLPWKIDISYKLNGVPYNADELAGKQGLVEVDLDILPNTEAIDYCKNNYVLVATTMFNADDIVSLEAPGSQNQLVGNLKTIIYMALPGEEQHFKLYVGSDDFSFGGFTFMEIPATLQQLEQITDLKEAKDKVKDSYDKINISLDKILNIMEGMDDSLIMTADGLDEIDAAREEISSSKGAIYNQVDEMAGDITTLSAVTTPFNEHVQEASDLAAETKKELNDLNSIMSQVKKDSEAARTSLNNLSTKLTDLSTTIDDIEEEMPKIRKKVSAINSEMSTLGKNVDNLKNSTSNLQNALSTVDEIKKIDTINIQGMTVSEARAATKKVNSLHESYLVSGFETFDEYLSDLVSKGYMTEEEKANTLKIWGYIQTSGGYENTLQSLMLADTANVMIDGINTKNIKSINVDLQDVLKASASTAGTTSTLCSNLGSDGLTGDLAGLMSELEVLMKTIENDDGTASSVVRRTADAAAKTSNLLVDVENAIDILDQVTTTVNNYEPKFQTTMQDCTTLINSLTETMNDSADLITNVTALTKSSGEKLDSGGQKSILGLSDALRQSAKGLAETSSIKTAKKSITDTIKKEVDDHSGKIDNLLNIDPNATVISMTSNQNPAPTSIQFIMRTQEIKVDKAAQKAAEEAAKAETTFLDRIVQMFKDFGAAITNAFS